jgi:hypothetical protein
MAPFGKAAVSVSKLVLEGMVLKAKLTGLTNLWAGVAVPCSIRTSAAGYPVAVFVALVEAVTRSSVMVIYRRIIHLHTHCLDTKHRDHNTDYCSLHYCKVSRPRQPTCQANNMFELIRAEKADQR